MAHNSEYRDTFTLVINDATVGHFTSVDVLDTAAQSSPSIDVETMKLRRMVDKRSAALDTSTVKQALAGHPKYSDIVLKAGTGRQAGRISKVDGFSIKQKTYGNAGQTDFGMRALQASTPLVLHAFQPAGGSWDPALLRSLPATPGQIVLWNVAGDPVARWHFTNAWPSKAPLQPGNTGSDFVLLVQALRRLNS